jgi:hypothetical protein
MAGQRRKGRAVRCQAWNGRDARPFSRRTQASEAPMLRLIGFVVLAVIVIALLLIFGLLDAIF